MIVRGSSVRKIATILLLLIMAQLPFVSFADNAPKSDAALFAEGRFGEAALSGEAAGTSESLALAARSHLVLARFYVTGDERSNHIMAALRDAQAALALDPNDANAALQVAIAWGFRARYEDKSSHARRSKKFIDQALALDPDYPHAHAALGGWNGEVVSRAGGFFAKLLFGAKRRIMNEHFDIAANLAPNSIWILSARAETLARLGKADDRVSAIRLLKEALSLTPADYFEGLLKDYSQVLLAALESGERDEIKRALDDYCLCQLPAD